MTKTTSTYNVNQFKQLIELNQNKTNFNVNFEIKSQNNDPFKALVVSEADLNSGKPLNYQEVKDGYITGNVANDKGVYQTYYLVLKSDSETQCDVTLDLKEIPLNPELKNQLMAQQKERQMAIERSRNEKEKMKEKEKEMEIALEKEQNRNRQLRAKKKESSPGFFGEYKWIIIVLVVIGIGAGVWFFFLKPKNKKSNSIEDGGTVGEIELDNYIEPVLKQPIKVPTSSLKVENFTEPIFENAPVVEPIIVQQQQQQIIPPPVFQQPAQQTQSVPELIETVSLAPPRIDSGRRNSALVNKLNNYFGNL